MFWAAGLNLFNNILRINEEMHGYKEIDEESWRICLALLDMNIC